MKQMTDSQRAAATERRRHVGVSAGAGSGKTSVMVERAVGLIKEGADVRSMLLVTFTVNATEGIRSRIRAALSQAAVELGDNRLRRQVSLLGAANISTIHAFCLDLIKEFFHVVGVDPMFTIQSEMRSAMMARDVMADVLEGRFRRTEEENTAFFALLDTLGEDGLTKLVLELDTTAQSMPDPMAYYANLVTPYEDFSWMDVWQERLKESIFSDVYTPVFSALHLTAGLTEARKYHDALNECKEAIGRAMAMEPGPEALQLLYSVTFPRITGLNKTDPETKAEAAGYIDAAKKGLGRIKNSLFYTATPEENQGVLTALCPLVTELRDILTAFHQELLDRKRDAHVLEFADVEHLALAILKDEGVQKELSERFTHVFIDEYQDVSPLQQAVMDALPGNHFFVGDIKQSIYGFRDAEPSLFVRRFYEYAQREDCLAVSLQHNFRSAPAIIHAVNAIFTACMHEDLGAVEYTRGHELIPGRKDEMEHQPELIILPDMRKEGLSHAQAQGAVIAERIKKLHEEGHPYSDMVILLRGMGQKGAQLRTALQKAGISVTTPPMGGHLTTPSMEALFDLLRAIDDPICDGAAITALSLFGFGPDDLAAIRLVNREVPFCEALRLKAEGEGEDGPIHRYYAAMARYRRIAARYGVERLLSTIKEEFAGPLTIYDVEQDNLGAMEALIAYAREYRTRGEGDLYGFLEIMEGMRKDPRAQREAAAMPPPVGDAVRMMTVHASKGLEFPIVFFALSESRFNIADLQGSLVDRSHGVALYRKGDVSERNPYREVAAKAIRTRNVEEEMRILYVALTRAEKQLYILGSRDHGKLDAPAPRFAQCYLDWILLAEDAFACTLVKDIPALTAAPMEPTDAPLRDAAMEEAILERLSYRYPHLADTLAPQRAAPSAVGKEAAETVELARPSFVGESEGFTPTERGTIVHRAMMLLDLGAIRTEDDVTAQLQHLYERELFTKEELTVVDAKTILRFTRSPIFMRMQQSGTIYRELPFNILIPAKELLMEGDHEVMVQGIVDCAFLEDGGIVIVDYKTDYVKPGGEGEIAEHYRHQMRIYKAAMERIFHLPVKEVCLFLLRIGQPVAVPMSREDGSGCTG